MNGQDTPNKTTMYGSQHKGERSTAETAVARFVGMIVWCER